MKLYIATPINARQEPTMREKLISAKHRVEYAVTPPCKK